MVLLDRFTVADVTGGGSGGDTLRLGAVGLAAGSAVAAWVELASLGAALRARALDPASVPRMPWGRIGLFTAIATAAAGIAGLLWMFTRSWPTMLTAAVVLPCFAGSYLAIAGALGLAESLRFWERLRSPRGRAP